MAFINKIKYYFDKTTIKGIITTIGITTIPIAYRLIFFYDDVLNLDKKFYNQKMDFAEKMNKQKRNIDEQRKNTEEKIMLEIGKSIEIQKLTNQYFGNILPILSNKIELDIKNSVSVHEQKENEQMKFQIVLIILSIFGCLLHFKLS